MSQWSNKSKDSDLFFCTNIQCNVLTFRSGPSGRNVCPKCYETGALVRSSSILPLGIRS